MLEDCNYFTAPPQFFLQVQAGPQLEIQPHTHDFVELVCIMRGHGTHSTDAGSHEIGVGDVFVIPVGGTHAFSNVSDMEVVNICFDPTRLPMPKLDMFGGRDGSFFAPKRGAFSPQHPYPLVHFEPEDFAPIRALAAELVRESKSEVFGHRFCLLGLFMVLLTKLERAFLEYDRTPQLVGTGVWRALNYMNAHYDEKFSLARLASRAGMSPSTFLRHFKNATGTTPSDYMTNIRIENASRLLIDTDKTNAEIAMICGFREESYMSRCFVRKTGQAPGALRRYWLSKPVANSSSNGIKGK